MSIMTYNIMNIYTEIHKLQKLIKGVRCSATEVLLSTTVQDGDAVAGCYKFAINTTSETLFYKDLNGLWKSVDGILGTTTEILSGGIVTLIADYDYDVSAAVYKINGVVYTSPQTTITLDPSDPLLDRIDTFVLTSSGTAVALTGTPDANPVSPTPNPVSQIGISIALVMAGTTEPGPVANNLWTDSGNHIYNTNVGNVGIGGIPNLGYAWAPKLHVFGNIQANGGLNVTTNSKTGIYGTINDLEFWNGNSKAATFTLLANSPGSYYTFGRGFVVSSGSGTQNSMRIQSSVLSNGANSMIHNQLLIDPNYNHQSFGTGLFRGIYYNPTTQDLNGAQHIAWENTSGDIIHGNLAYVGSLQKLVATNTIGKLEEAVYHEGELNILGGFSTGANTFEIQAPGNNGLMFEMTPLDESRTITFDMPVVFSGQDRVYTFQNADGTLAFLSDLTLNNILTTNNETTADAKVGSIMLYDSVNSIWNTLSSGQSKLIFNDTNNSLDIFSVDCLNVSTLSMTNLSNLFTTTIQELASGITANRTYELPDQDGTVQINNSDFIDLSGLDIFLTKTGCFEIDDSVGGGKLYLPDPANPNFSGGEIVLGLNSSSISSSITINVDNGGSATIAFSVTNFDTISQGQMAICKCINNVWRVILM